MAELRVGDALRPLPTVPVVAPRVFLKQVLEEMNRHRLGIACVVDPGGRLLGIITDGDLRRTLLRTQKPLAALFVDDAITHANTSPTTIASTEPLERAIAVMEELEVWDLPVVDGSGVLEGLLHLHPVVKALMGASASTAR